MGLDFNAECGSMSYPRYDEFIAKVASIYGAIPNKRQEGTLEIPGLGSIPDIYMHGILNKEHRFMYPKNIVIPICMVILLEHSNCSGQIDNAMCHYIYEELTRIQAHFRDPDGYMGLDSTYRQFMVALEEVINEGKDLIYC